MTHLRLPPRPWPLRTAALLALLAGGARADEPAPETAAPPAPEERVEETRAGSVEQPPVSEPAPPPMRGRSPYRLGGVVVPLVGFNTTDGVGFGAGGNFFLRRRELDFGYRDMFTVSTYWVTSGNYTSNMFQYERRGTHFFVARLNYRYWTDMIYVGAGGRSVATDLPDEATRANRMSSPSALVSAQFHVRDMPFRVWTQGYAHFAQVTPNPGGVLDQERPYGALGGWYADASVGLFVNEVDRWPLPNKGVVAQTSVRGGFSTGDGKVNPIVGVNVEAAGWIPLAGQRLVLAGRFLFDKTWGKRPFYEKEWLGGTMRDELGYEQITLGYGRTRTRGDGVLATAIDLRAWIGRTRHPFFDASFTVDVWGELAYVFDEERPGPPLPSVGFGPGILWQGATLLRPWFGWGWLSEGPDAPRTAQGLFGLALVEPL